MNSETDIERVEHICTLLVKRIDILSQAVNLLKEYTHDRFTDIENSRQAYFEDIYSKIDKLELMAVCSNEGFYDHQFKRSTLPEKLFQDGNAYYKKLKKKHYGRVENES